MEEIFIAEAQRIAANGGELSGTKDEIVMAANVESAIERQARFEAERLARG